jgi:hypothetical protein
MIPATSRFQRQVEKNLEEVRYSQIEQEIPIGCGFEFIGAIRKNRYK